MLISLFFTFPVISTFWLADTAAFSKILAKNQFLKYQKNYAYKKWKFRPRIEIKNFKGLKSFRKEIFVGSTWNYTAPKSVDMAEMAKNGFLRQSST